MSLTRTSIFKLSGIISLVLLVGVLALDTGTLGPTAATFSRNGFDLKIDSHALYNGAVVPGSTWTLKNLHPYQDKFFNFDDVKPGDFGENTISFHVNKDAYVCLDFGNLRDYENGQNEPEAAVDTSLDASELVDGTEFFAWYDDGDDLFEVGEIPIFGTSTQAASVVLDSQTYALADASGGVPFVKGETSYIGLVWCAGDLMVDVDTALVTCDGNALGNEAQTDSFSVDVSFRAVPVKDNQHFTCERTGYSCKWPNHVGPIHITSHNEATVTNNITVYASSGDNSAGDGGTVRTGLASATASLRSFINRITNRI